MNELKEEPSMRMLKAAPLVLRLGLGLGLAVLVGCKERKAAEGAPDAGMVSKVTEAAEQAVRASRPRSTEMEFRGVQVYAQAMPHRWAICGQVSPFADDQALFVPFVSIVEITAGGTASVPDAPFVGISVIDADRTYLALVAHCYNKGGPTDGPMQSVPPMPPVPNTIAAPSLAPLASGVAPATGSRVAAPASSSGEVPVAVSPPDAQASQAALPVSGDVTMRQNANLHAAPHGPSVRVVPQGTALRIFGAAPGGWYQVGDTAPWGWVHESMLDRH